MELFFYIFEKTENFAVGNKFIFNFLNLNFSNKYLNKKYQVFCSNFVVKIKFLMSRGVEEVRRTVCKAL